jgi:hypothetical protein
VLAALRQNDTERLGGDLGVLEKQFVKIAHPVDRREPGFCALIALYCAGVGEAWGVIIILFFIFLAATARALDISTLAMASSIISMSISK